MTEPRYSEPRSPAAASGPVAARTPLSRTPLALGFRRFKANRAAMGSLIILAVMSLACFSAFAFTATPQSVSKLEQSQVGLPHPWSPTWHHPFGTDTNGRDLLMRTLHGGAISLSVGLTAAAISVLIGTFYGAISGQAGGAVDRWMMRFVDTLYGLPYILLVILLMVYTQKDPRYAFWMLFIAIGCVTWLTMARIVRGQVLRLRQEDFVIAARALGAGPLRLLLFHLLPNLMGPIIVCATLTVPVAILQESFLSFLGLGISAPLASWGTLASDAVNAVNPVVNYWWLLVFPCLMLGVTLLCLNFIGDGLRDALDPKMIAAKTE